MHLPASSFWRFVFVCIHGSIITSSPTFSLSVCLFFQMLASLTPFVLPCFRLLDLCLRILLWIFDGCLVLRYFHASTAPVFFILFSFVNRPKLRFGTSTVFIFSTLCMHASFSSLILHLLDLPAVF